MATRQIQQPVQIELPEDLAPGFRVLPGGNIGYSVADDYPKQMAQIAASLDALATNRATRSTPLTNTELDAMENDLLNRRQMFPSWGSRAIANAIPRAQTVKAGSDVYQLTRDASGNLVPTKIIDTPETPRKTPTQRGPVGFTERGEPILSGNWTQNQWMMNSNSIPEEIRTNQPVASYLNPSWWDAGMTATQPVATNAPVVMPTRTPMMAIGGAATPLSAMTNAPAEAEAGLVKTKSGRTYKILSY